MPVDYIVTDGGMLVVEKWVGAIRHAELITHERNQLQDSSIAPGAKVFVEARGATFPETSLDLVHELSDLHGNPDNKTSISVYAILIGNADSQKAQLFADQARKYGVRIIVFGHFDVACTWLGMTTREVLALINEVPV